MVALLSLCEPKFELKHFVKQPEYYEECRLLGCGAV
jgi:hypothetical protein